MTSPSATPRVRRSVIALGLLSILAAAACSSSEPTSPAAPVDASTSPVDGGVRDASAAADGSVLVDGGFDAPATHDYPPCSTTYADCTTFTDLTAAGADRRITFQNYAYAPKCARIKLGQTVTFAGDFAAHPLEQACGPDGAFAGSTGTPIVLPQAGRYGYFCLDHGSSLGQSMAGLVEVVP